MNSSMRKRFIFSDVIVCLFFLASLIIFSTISDAQSQSRKVTHERQVRIYGEDKVTINANDSFNPNQYYKAVGDDHHPVKLNYTNINTSKPGRYALTLSAKNKQDYDKRTVLIIIEEEKSVQKPQVEKEAQPNQTPASSSKETTQETAKSSATQSSVTNHHDQKKSLKSPFNKNPSKLHKKHYKSRLKRQNQQMKLLLNKNPYSSQIKLHF